VGQEPPPFLFSFGGYGTEPGQLKAPRSLAIHGDEIYVLEYSNKRVSVFDLQGVHLRHWGDPGTEAHQIYLAKQLTVTPEGFVYITDHERDIVQKFTLDGVFVLSWGGTGTADDQFDQPDGITFDADGDIWVVDRINNALKEFDADGNFLSSVVTNDLVGATDLVPAADGTFYATIWNTLYTGMRHLDASATRLGETAARFQSPRGLFRASNGDLYVVATGPPNRAYIVDSTSLEVITDWGGYGPADDQFDAPYDVAIAPNGNVYIADSGHHLVKVFGSPVTTRTTSWGRMKGGFTPRRNAP
jgi:DNA-binding beta-propeller fold protein YncE